MRSFAALALLGTASAFTYQQNIFSDSSCTTAVSKFPPALCVSDTCCPMSSSPVFQLQLKYTGTCGAAVYNKYDTKAACEAGTGGTVMSTIDLGRFASGGCQPGGSGQYHTVTTSCSSAGNAGNSVSPGAWSMVVAAASVVAVMK